jgi:hypothetical protein
MRIAIVTFYDNKERYILGQKRQKESLKDVGFDYDYFAFNSFVDIESPTHEEIPYAFKPYSIKKVKDLGYDIVIWMDSPVYGIKSLNNFIETIINKSVILFDNIGYTIGDYTSDKCLEHFNISRKESFEIQMIMACLMGFDFRTSLANNVFNEYYNSATEDIFGGYWTNEANQVSTDNRVKGHRHDQSVMSILANKYKLSILHPHSTYFAYFGNPGHLPHAESVCLLSAGY